MLEAACVKQRDTAHLKYCLDSSDSDKITFVLRPLKIPNNLLSFRKSSISAKSMSKGSAGIQSDVSISFCIISSDGSASDAVSCGFSTIGVDEAGSSGTGETVAEEITVEG